MIPLHLTEDWNLITRTIMPIINQPSLVPGDDSAFGLGDLNPTFFLSPAKPGTLIWGGADVHPADSDRLAAGHGKWSMGPAAVALSMQGPWVFGALANQQWSFAGWGDTDVSAMLIQPFVNYNLPDGLYLVSAPIITANWKASSGDKWTVPVGGGAGKLFKLDKLPDQYPAAGLLQRGAAPVGGGLAAALPAAVSLPQVDRGHGVRGMASTPRRRDRVPATIRTAIAFLPMQKSASFDLWAVKEQIDEAIGAGRRGQ